MSDQLDFELRLDAAVKVFAASADAAFDANGVASTALRAGNQGRLIRWTPAPGDFNRRAFRLGGAAVGLLVAALILNWWVGLVGISGPQSTPARSASPSPTASSLPSSSPHPDDTVQPTIEPRAPASSDLYGTWFATNPDEGTRYLRIGSSDDGVIRLVLHDDFAPACSGAATTTGTGRVLSDIAFLFPELALSCNNGRQPQATGEPSSRQQLRNVSLTFDPGASSSLRTDDIITDSFGSTWTCDCGTPDPAPPLPTQAQVTDLLKGFIAARVAGEGAQLYLNEFEQDVPLVYATTAGRPYERGKFEVVRGIDWPYGYTAFKVRLFAGDTVVEQLFFTPADGHLGLEYEPSGFGTHIAPTTENGQPVARPYRAFNDEVTVNIPHPWVFFGQGGPIRLIPDGPGVRPTTDGGERNDWYQLRVMTDSAPCGQAGPGPMDAAAWAESIGSNPDLYASDPVVVRNGGLQGLAIAAELSVAGHSCGAIAQEDRMWLYLFDAPEGSSMRVVAVAIVVPKAQWDRATANPITVEFNRP